MTDDSRQLKLFATNATGKVSPEAGKRLRFDGAVEEQFRRFYSESSLLRARLIPGFSVLMSMFAMVLHLSEPDTQMIVIWFYAFLMLPVLITTLFLSTQPDLYKPYQVMLALSGLLSGLVIVSIVYRPILTDMPSYFSMVTTWIIAIWLILGLRFWIAAGVALAVTASHIQGMLFVGAPFPVATYELIMLLLVNGIGAVGCYHLESGLRRGFAHSLEVNELARELRKLAQLDGLTGLHNRRSYDEYIERVWKQSRREHVAIAIMLIDIDHFKAYNDHYGHQQGDDTLREVARIIGACERRPLDFAGRYGGEEFVIALYDQDQKSTEMIADSLRAAIESLEIPHVRSKTNTCLTISIGAAVILPDAERSCAGALQMADEALYEAKEAGRNRVIMKESGMSSLETGRFRGKKRVSA